MHDESAALSDAAMPSFLPLSRNNTVSQASAYDSDIAGGVIFFALFDEAARPVCHTHHYSPPSQQAEMEDDEEKHMHHY